MFVLRRSPLPLLSLCFPPGSVEVPQDNLYPKDVLPWMCQLRWLQISCEVVEAFVLMQVSQDVRCNV